MKPKPFSNAYCACASSPLISPPSPLTTEVKLPTEAPATDWSFTVTGKVFWTMNEATVL
ncbi:hypothetical protein D3C86_2097120 [compost metagenome]